ncbi:hypothetical protein CMV30_08455 [Nibricoccus aquaticus]|uniref:Peptidase S9 prolyl oligopeptidase catalytic domain-containing protein n=1 Tax=Nibricoccus aquaticus TaxID=2576891 RepID=A0A290Q5M2_9BACT|nr:S9 family peptidase [Nibricoccus aquaticus]ATC63975.1 hypothetical protein CMV30_08455 [Nibricoccus aquaticus]
MSSMTPLAVAAAILAITGSAYAKPPHPLDRIKPVPETEAVPTLDFYRPPLFRSPQINSAGTHFAALFSDNDDTTNLLVTDITTGKLEPLGAGRNSDVESFYWLGDRHLMLWLTKEKRYARGMFVAQLSRLSEAYQIEAYNVLHVIGIPRKNPLQPVVWLRANAWDNGRDYGVLKINAKQEIQPVNDGWGLDSKKFPHGTTASVISSYAIPTEGVPAGYTCDNQGELAFAYTQDKGIFTIHRLVDQKWVPCPINLDETEIVGSGDVPGELIVTVPSQNGKPRALHRMDSATGQLGELLYQDDKYDPDGVSLYRHPVSQKIIGLQFTRSGPQTIWLDENYRALQKRLNASFPVPNTVLRIIGSDEAEKRFVVAALSDRCPVAYYQIDLEKGQLGLIKSTAPWIDPKRMLPMQTMTYKTRDGFRIEGYLTLPAGASKEKPAPLLVLPHGGPQARDVWGFNSEVQFFASRGYAVFQPNYRGSTSYQWQFSGDVGWEFTRMHDDVTDGVKALFKTGLIDSRRVAIMGWSFGGYLALAGAVQEKNLYRCAVALAGVYDWEQVIRESKNDDYFRSKHAILLRKLGNPKTQRELFEEISPLRRVSQIKIPVFVAHGKDDLIADVAQSKRLVTELERYNIPFEKHLLSGEGHGFSYYKNRVEIAEAIEAFLAKNLTPLPAELASVAGSIP